MESRAGVLKSLKLGLWLNTLNFLRQIHLGTGLRNLLLGSLYQLGTQHGLNNCIDTKGVVNII